jgi:hypothetical protein
MTESGVPFLGIDASSLNMPKSLSMKVKKTNFWKNRTRVKQNFSSPN